MPIFMYVIYRYRVETQMLSITCKLTTTIQTATTISSDQDMYVEIAAHYSQMLKANLIQEAPKQIPCITL